MQYTVAGLFNVFEPEEMDDGDIVNVFTFAIGSNVIWESVYGFEVVGKVFADMYGNEFF